MAWTEFYIQPGGDNANAGTTTSNTATVSTTNGNWDTSTNRFTAASGTPFTGASVGDFAAIMLDGAVGFTSLNQITAVDPGGTYIDVTAIGRVGIAPTTSATGRTCRIGGAWADFGNASTGSGFGTSSTNTVPLRINVKAATYANASTARVFAHGGTTAAPVWIRGYNTTPGDLENDYVNAPPLLTFAAAGFTISGSNYIASNISLQNTGSSSTIWNWSGTMGKAERIRAEGTNTNAGASAFTSGGNGASMTVNNSWFKVPTTANNCTSTSSTALYKGCTFEGGINGFNTSTVGATFIECVFKGQVDRGATATTAAIGFFRCTFLERSSDAIRWTGTIGGMCHVVDCVFNKSGGYDINNSGGTNSNLVNRSGNVTFQFTIWHENGFEDSAFHKVSDVALSTVSSSDPTLVPGSLALGSVTPRPLENVAYTSYRDAGAVQHQDVGMSSAPCGGDLGLIIQARQMIPF